jgi:hypothetical protein
MDGTAMNEVEPNRGWPGVGRVAGYVSAGALLVGTILYLLDATNALGANNYTFSGGSPIRDEAGYWVAQFAHQHHILWDIIARDTLFPVAFMALIVVALAVRAVVRTDRPDAQLMVAFFLVGGTISILSDLIFLGATDYWRVTGWSNLAPTNMVAAGRSEQAIESLTRWPEAAGFVVLAAALVCLGNLCRSEATLPARLGLLAYGEAALLVGIALAGIMQTGTPYDVFSLVTGAIVGPLLAFWLGHHLGAARAERAAGPTPAVT